MSASSDQSMASDSSASNQPSLPSSDSRSAAAGAGAAAGSAAAAGGAKKRKRGKRKRTQAAKNRSARQNEKRRSDTKTRKAQKATAAAEAAEAEAAEAEVGSDQAGSDEASDAPAAPASAAPDSMECNHTCCTYSQAHGHVYRAPCRRTLTKHLSKRSSHRFHSACSSACPMHMAAGNGEGNGEGEQSGPKEDKDDEEEAKKKAKADSDSSAAAAAAAPSDAAAARLCSAASGVAAFSSSPSSPSSASPASSSAQPAASVAVKPEPIRRLQHLLLPVLLQLQQTPLQRRKGVAPRLTTTPSARCEMYAGPFAEHPVVVEALKSKRVVALTIEPSQRLGVMLPDANRPRHFDELYQVKLKVYKMALQRINIPNQDKATAVVTWLALHKPGVHLPLTEETLNKALAGELGNVIFCDYAKDIENVLAWYSIEREDGTLEPVHFLYADKWCRHRSSLFSLLEDQHTGITLPSYYLKTTLSIFRLHDEQCKFPFFNYCFSGSSVWYFVMEADRDKLDKYILEQVCKEWGVDLAKLSNAEQDLFKLLICAKGIMFSPAEVAAAGITVHRHVQRAGQVVIGHGTCAHWGFVNGDSCGQMAVNTCDVSWLEDGLPTLVEHLQRVQSYHRMEAAVKADVSRRCCTISCTTRRSRRRYASTRGAPRCSARCSRRCSSRWAWSRRTARSTCPRRSTPRR